MPRGKNRQTLSCQECGADTEIIDGRASPGHSYRRRRKCVKCKARFTTFERMATDDVPDPVAQKQIEAIRAILREE